MRNTVRALRLCLVTAVRAAPAMVLMQCLVSVAEAVTAPVQAYGVKLLVDGLTDGAQRTIAWGIGVVLGGFAITFLAKVLTGQLMLTTDEKTFARVFRDLLTTTTSVPGISHHETPTVADRTEYVREHSVSIGFSFQFLMHTGAVAANAVAVVALLAAVHPALLALPLLGLARVWAAYVGARWTTRAAEATTQQGRLAKRLSDICRDPRHALELRVFGLQQILLDRLTELQSARARMGNRAVIRAATLEGAVRIGFAIAYALAILWAISMARSGRLSAGDVALVILVAPQLDQLAGGIAGQASWLADTLRVFTHYDWLRRYADENSWSDADQPAPEQLHSGIHLDDVSFTYPEAGTPSLSNVSLALPAGTTVALVGDNGAGKTTLVKLLARMYDPTDGAVRIDGVDLRVIDPAQWRQRISAGFQDFVKFEFHAREAVGIGDLARLDDDATIAAALERADAQTVVEQLPEGLNTQLGKQFAGGHDPSGGQWQRIALARAFMRTRPVLLLLDEPTAALDPESEHALFERFAAASKTAADETGGITLLVSHRFSTVRMADLIVVMDDGRVAEMGTHDALVSAGGRYAQLFALQARAYR